jgi:microcystin-dependent protein
MADPFIGQIQAFGFNFAPRGWAFCRGQLLPIAQNTALFSLLGTYYGGDGRTTFGLPDLQGRSSLAYGSGPGLPNYQIGAKGGTETVTLNDSQIPQHRHTAMGSAEEADSVDSTGRVPATIGTPIYSATLNATMNADMIGLTGGGQAHNNMQPFLVINWCIATIGSYPPRS